MRKSEKVRKRAIRTSRHTFFNEIKYLLEGLTNRFDAARKTISELRLDLKNDPKCNPGKLDGKLK